MKNEHRSPPPLISTTNAASASFPTPARPFRVPFVQVSSPELCFHSLTPVVSRLQSCNAASSAIWSYSPIARPPPSPPINYPHSHTRRLCSTEWKGKRGAVPSGASRSRTVEAGARRLWFVKEAPVKVAVRHGAAGSGRKGRSTAVKRGDAG